MITGDRDAGRTHGARSAEAIPETVTLSIDGHRVRIHGGASILTAARTAGIEILSLCHHEALEPYGGCRLCMVEAVHEGRDDPPRIVAACLCPAENGMVVRTATPRVLAIRREILELLLARCPESPLVRRLAREHGIVDGVYPRTPEPTACILCGLCTRVCDALGPAAISLVGRGIGREVAPPFHEPPPDCIGCLACAAICPTGHIPFARSHAGNTIWGRTFVRAQCPTCGRPTRTVAEIDFWTARTPISRADMERCESCKRAATGAVIDRLAGRLG
jgi:NADH dehydrogenase/NADH:ubiquinone oxidoreductase subunit G